MPWISASTNPRTEFESTLADSSGRGSSTEGTAGRYQVNRSNRSNPKQFQQLRSPVLGILSIHTRVPPRVQTNIALCSIPRFSLTRSPSTSSHWPLRKRIGNFRSIHNSTTRLLDNPESSASPQDEGVESLEKFSLSSLASQR